MVTAVEPADAAGILLSMTPDRLDVLLNAVNPAALARILCGVSQQQRVDLLAAMPAARMAHLAQQLTMQQLRDLLSTIPLPYAAGLLRHVAPRAAAELLSDLPERDQQVLQTALSEDVSSEFWSSMYERRATESIVNTAARAMRLNSRTCDLLAEVFGKIIHVAVRYRAREPLSDSDVDETATSANWRDITGLIVMTNLAATAGARTRIEAIQKSGRRLVVLRWIDDGDDGVLKRALVRMIA